MNTPEKLKIGSISPPFDLPCNTGANISLSALKGQKVVLYFYPKNDTPGCTLEAKDFTNHIITFKKNNCSVIGISKDNVKSHCNFIGKHALDLILASDVDGTTCQNYGVWVEKNMYGKKSMGIDRSTFLIDASGKIAHIWRKVKVNDHVTKVLQELKKLDK